MTLHHHRRHFLLAGLATALAPAFAQASPLSIVPQPEQVGKGRLTIFMTPILDVALFAPDARWRSDAPYALQVTFLRSLEGHKLVGHVLDEMRHIGFGGDPRLMQWGQSLDSILPDVTKGDVLTGVRDERGGARFYLGTQPIGHVADTVFTNAFFGICLSPRTSQPQLRRDVLGRYG
jgi:hypothetical protein